MDDIVTHKKKIRNSGILGKQILFLEYRITFEKGVGNNEVHLFSFAFVFTVAKDIIRFHPWEVKR